MRSKTAKQEDSEEVPVLRGLKLFFLQDFDVKKQF